MKTQQQINERIEMLNQMIESKKTQMKNTEIENHSMKNYLKKSIDSNYDELVILEWILRD